jgi:hypothetical protein
MKRCCLLEKKLETCADCPDFRQCGIIQSFFAKKGYKYGKYRQSLEYIRTRGYPVFLAAARPWKLAYGRLNKDP